MRSPLPGGHSGVRHLLTGCRSQRAQSRIRQARAVGGAEAAQARLEQEADDASTACHLRYHVSLGDGTAEDQ